MDLGIAGKLAVVTGSSGGMGRNIARALAAEGARPVLFARSADKLAEVAREITADFGVEAVAVPGSMLIDADVRRLATAIRELGGPDILVLVTGRPPFPIKETLEENDVARWREAYENQLLSVIQTTNGIVPLMLDRGWGRVIAITSASAKQPMEHHSLSTVFRAGVTAYMRGLANEIGQTGVTVNCVAPALIDTTHRQAANAYTPEQAERRKKLSRLGRMGTQEELCGVVAFLASQQSGFVTGSTIVVDGGMVSSLF